MRILLVSFLCLSAMIPNSFETKKFSKKDLTILYDPLFETFKASNENDWSQCCSYGYVRPGDRQYYEGLNGIFNYSDYAMDGVIQYLDIDPPNEWGSVKHYEKLVGMKAYAVELDDQEWGSNLFQHYNPKFIKALKNLIPSKEFSINGVSVKEVYGNYSRFFRLLTESYLYLYKNGTCDSQANNYIKDVENGEDGLDVLFGSYHYALNEAYEVPSGSEITSPFESHMAFGFWLRRNLDGTHDEIYNVLKIIMNRFDKRWFKMIRKKY